MRPILAALALAGVLLLPQAIDRASAHWKPEYASQPIEVQQWFHDAELTPEAQRRLFPNSAAYPRIKCCDHADVVKTHFEVNHTDGRDEWFYEDSPGHMKRIPDDIIHWGESAPGGQPTLFVWQGKETCFFPGDGGI